MDRTTLVRSLPKEGKQLINLLQQQLDLKAALWLYFEEADEWRLVLATPLVDKEGPRRVYERIQETLAEQQSNISISLTDISVLSPNDPMIKPLTEALNGREADDGMTVKRGVITGNTASVYLEDAFIYFAHK